MRVIKTKIKIFPHPSADNLELIKAGSYQVVSKKGIYKEGDTAIIVPKDAILPDNLAEPFRKYLKGKEHNRVGEMFLRGELSEGILLEDEENKYLLDIDISEELGIIKYSPTIPQHLEGEVEPLEFDGIVHRHDCEQLTIYRDEFIEGERVYVFEKIHGTQVAILKSRHNSFSVSSKGLIAKRLCIKEDDNNLYWRAAKEDLLLEYLKDYYTGLSVQAFGEIVPSQKGFNYGFSCPAVLLFRLFIEGVEMSYDCIPDALKDDYWCPYLGTRLFNFENILEFGKSLERSHLDYRGTVPEGIVISPKIPRKAADGTPLYLKVISDLYREQNKGLSC